MKKFLFALIIIAALSGIWYFLSPLFINKTVDEQFSFDGAQDKPFDKSSLRQSSLRQSSGQAGRAPSTEDLTEENSEINMIGETTLLASGQFTDGDSFHKGSGMASVYKLPDGSRLLRLENFDVTNGPDLRVLMAVSKTDVALGYIELAKLKGNTGNQNYQVPTAVNIETHGNIIIYCQPFHVIFATAALN